MSATITVHNFSGPINNSGASYNVIIDPERRDVRDWSCIGPGVPGEVWHRRAVMLRVPASTHPASLQQAVEENLDLIEEIISTYEGTEWDGSNHVGQWQADADDPIMRVCEWAVHALEQLFEQVPGVVDAGDWFGYSAHRLGDLLVSPSDADSQTLADIAAALIEDAEQQGDIFFSDDKQEQTEELLLRLVTDELDELEEREEDEDDELDTEEVAWLTTLRRLWTAAQAA